MRGGIAFIKYDCFVSQFHDHSLQRHLSHWWGLSSWKDCLLSGTPMKHLQERGTPSGPHNRESPKVRKTQTHTPTNPYIYDIADGKAHGSKSVLPTSSVTGNLTARGEAQSPARISISWISKNPLWKDCDKCVKDFDIFKAKQTGYMENWRIQSWSTCKGTLVGRKVGGFQPH